MSLTIDEQKELARNTWTGLHYVMRWTGLHYVMSKKELSTYTAAVEAKERERCAKMHDCSDVLAPIGNSGYGEAYQDGWIAGTSAYRDAIRSL